MKHGDDIRPSLSSNFPGDSVCLFSEKPGTKSRFDGMCFFSLPTYIGLHGPNPGTTATCLVHHNSAAQLLSIAQLLSVCRSLTCKSWRKLLSFFGTRNRRPGPFLGVFGVCVAQKLFSSMPTWVYQTKRSCSFVCSRLGSGSSTPQLYPHTSQLD